MLPPSRARAYRLSDTGATSGRETIYEVSVEVSFLDDGRSLNAGGKEATIDQRDLSMSCGALPYRVEIAAETMRALTPILIQPIIPTFAANSCNPS